MEPRPRGFACNDQQIPDLRILFVYVIKKALTIDQIYQLPKNLCRVLCLVYHLLHPLLDEGLQEAVVEEFLNQSCNEESLKILGKGC